MKPTLTVIAILSTIFATAVAIASVFPMDESRPGTSSRSRLERPKGETAAVAGSIESWPTFSENLRQFDMICDVRGHVSGNLYPESYRGTPALNPDPWHHVTRESIDLDRMEACGGWCRWSPPTPIAEASPERITIHDEPWITTWVRRSDGAYHFRKDEDGRISEETGTCSRAPFTEFLERKVVENPPRARSVVESITTEKPGA